jgi:hypothetical protein
MVTVNVKLEPTICRTGGEDTNHVHVFQEYNIISKISPPFLF